MTWNHRVIKTRDEVMDEDIFSVHEAYYINSKGKKSKKPMLTVEPVRITGSSIKDIEWLLDVVKNSLKKPIINQVKQTKKQKLEHERHLMQSYLASAGGAALRMLELDPGNKEAGFVEYLIRVQLKSLMEE